MKALLRICMVCVCVSFAGIASAQAITATALQHLLHAAGDVVVLLTHHLRVQEAREGRQRVHGRIDGTGKDGAPRR